MPGDSKPADPDFDFCHMVVCARDALFCCDRRDWQAVWAQVIWEVVSCHFIHFWVVDASPNSCKYFGCRAPQRAILDFKPISSCGVYSGDPLLLLDVEMGAPKYHIQ